MTVHQPCAVRQALFHTFNLDSSRFPGEKTEAQKTSVVELGFAPRSWVQDSVAPGPDVPSARWALPGLPRVRERGHHGKDAGSV